MDYSSTVFVQIAFSGSFSDCIIIFCIKISRSLIRSRISIFKVSRDTLKFLLLSDAAACQSDIDLKKKKVFFMLSVGYMLRANLWNSGIS